MCCKEGQQAGWVAFYGRQNRLQILSLDFGRELRNLINSEEYRRIFLGQSHP